MLGVGKKRHDVHADQWWARAFDDTLKGLNTTKSEATGKTEGIAFGASAQALQMVGIGGAKWAEQGGLYSNFVRGESLSGSPKLEEKGHRETHSQSEDQRKRMRGSDEVDPNAATAGNNNRSKRKRRQQEELAEGLKLVRMDAIEQGQPQGSPNSSETKEQRRQRKREKKARRALKVGQSRQLPGNPQATAGNDFLAVR